ncbi:MAG: hypothetical protein ABJN34_01570 [Litoreibacter sp.]|uniref:hypothetical protein n=1 Tax=Litoreibacter sp. TaxID=1969459 RepID=UPI003298A66E
MYRSNSHIESAAIENIADNAVTNAMGHVKADADPSSYRYHMMDGRLGTGRVMLFLGVGLFVFLVASVTASNLGSEVAGRFGVGAFVLYCFGLVSFLIVQRKRNGTKLEEMQLQIHELEQEELKLRVELAKKNGDLDRWNTKS